jgi:excisionase family DNA binding protein
MSSATVSSEAPVIPSSGSASDLITVQSVANDKLGGCSIRHVRRLYDSGKMPAPIKLGALIRFRRAEIDAWIAGGCKPVRAVAKGGAR